MTTPAAMVPTTPAPGSPQLSSQAWNRSRFERTACLAPPVELVSEGPSGFCGTPCAISLDLL